MSEFSRIVPISAIGRTPDFADSASADECAAVAARLGLAAVDALAVTARLALTADGATLAGRIDARITQYCAASNLPVPAHVVADFSLRYVRELSIDGTVGEDGLPEVELGASDCDVLPLDGESIDVGDAAVQTLALAMAPFPRHPDAETVLHKAGVLSEDSAGPFAALAALKRPAG